MKIILLLILIVLVQNSAVTIESCQMMNTDGQNCDICEQGYGKFEEEGVTKCQYCGDQIVNEEGRCSEGQKIENCLFHSTSRPGLCVQCIPQFTQDGLFQCKKLTNCLEYITSQFQTSDIKCENCKEGYKRREFYYNQYIVCEQFEGIENCDLHNEEKSECLKCKEGDFYLKEDKTCGQGKAIENCQIQSNSDANRCVQCEEDYKKIEGETKDICEEILIRNCQDILSESVCKTCKEGYNYQSEDTPWSLFEGRCENYGDAIENCWIHGRPGDGCLLCKEGYVLNQLGQCFLNAGIENCKVHEEVEGNVICTQCMEGYGVLENESGCKEGGDPFCEANVRNQETGIVTCSGCREGYKLKYSNNIQSCILGTKIDNCKIHYPWEGGCYLCEDNFTNISKDDVDFCVQEILVENCQELNADSECTKCIHGYSMKKITSQDNVDSIICVKVNEGEEIKGCKIYENSDAEGVLKCIECHTWDNDNTLLVDGICFDEGLEVVGCKSYQRDSEKMVICSECLDEYEAQNQDNAVLCNKKIENCDISEGQTCIKCQDNYLSIVNYEGDIVECKQSVENPIDNCSIFDQSSRCVQCKSGFALYYNPNSYNKECITQSKVSDPNCAEYNEKHICSQCIEGYVVAGSELNRKCLKSESKIKGCAVYDENNVSKCIKCAEFRDIIHQGQCMSETWKCVSYNEAFPFQCLQCEEGYTLQNEGSNSVRCYEQIENCNVQEMSNCIQCNEGFNFNVKNQKKCFQSINTPLDNCLRYDIQNISTEYETTICGKCKDGYRVQNGKCHLNTIENCLDQYSITGCNKCITGYQFIEKYNPQKGGKSDYCLQFSSVIENCKEYYGEEGENCKECEQGYFKDQDDKKCVKQSGNVSECLVSSEDNDYICEDCGEGKTFYLFNTKGRCRDSESKISNCLIYDDNYLCFECGAPYILATNKKSCQTEKEYSCQEVDTDSPDKCKVCADNYSLRVDGVCIDKKIISGCKVYGNNHFSECETCEQDYTLKKSTENGDKCEKNIQNCEAVSGELCSKCEETFTSITDLTNNNNQCVGSSTVQEFLSDECLVYEKVSEGEIVCSQCKDGFNNDNMNKKCVENSILNCAVQEGDDVCRKCLEGYKLIENSTCFESTTFIENCLFYSGSEGQLCGGCEEKYYLDEGNVNCVKSQGNVENCKLIKEDNLNICLECAKEMLFLASKDLDLYPGKCSDSSVPIDYCSMHDYKGNCLQCLDGYKGNLDNSECLKIVDQKETPVKIVPDTDPVPGADPVNNGSRLGISLLVILVSLVCL